jgi:hypothetical protein
MNSFVFFKFVNIVPDVVDKFPSKPSAIYLLTQYLQH